MIHRVWVMHAIKNNGSVNSNHALVARLELEIPTDVPVETVLNLAFEKSNSIDRKWTDNPEVQKVFHEGCIRSTSVGDILMTFDRVFIVEAFGFKEITKERSTK